MQYFPIWISFKNYPFYVSRVKYSYLGMYCKIIKLISDCQMVRFFLGHPVKRFIWNHSQYLNLPLFNSPFFLFFSFPPIRRGTFKGPLLANTTHFLHFKCNIIKVVPKGQFWGNLGGGMGLCDPMGVQGCKDLKKVDLEFSVTMPEHNEDSIVLKQWQKMTKFSKWSKFHETWSVD